MIDLDQFKEVNDTLGHEKGDHLLVDVAKRIVDCVPMAATVARLGGDEFAIILPETVAVGAGGRHARLPDPGDQRAVHARHRPGVRLGQHRRRPVPRGRHRDGRTAAPCRPGHVRGQAVRAQPLLPLSPWPACRGPGTLDADPRLAHRFAECRVRGLLPAHRRPGNGPHAQGRGPAAMEPSDARAGEPRRIHPAGRIEWPDPRNRRMGVWPGRVPGQAHAGDAPTPNSRSASTSRRCRSSAMARSRQGGWSICGRWAWRRKASPSKSRKACCST